MKKCIILSLVLLISISAIALNNENKPVKEQPKITFIELGSVNCIPCKMMKPVMKPIEKKYPN